MLFAFTSALHRTSSQRTPHHRTHLPSTLFAAGFFSLTSNYPINVDSTPIKPDCAEAWYNRSNTLGKLGRIVDALAACEQAIKIDPNYAEAWSNKGIALSHLGHYEEALQACGQAIKIDPDCAEAWTNRGVALVGLDRYEETLQACEQALGLSPDYAKAWYNKGIALGRLRRHEEALQAFYKTVAISLKPGAVRATHWSRRGAMKKRWGCMSRLAKSILIAP